MQQWQAVAGSAIGTKHISGGTPCQDYAAYQIILEGQVTIGAVADGMGSAAHSEIGSKMAVEVAIYQLSLKNWLAKPITQSEAKVFFNSLLNTVVDRLEQQAKTKNFSLKDLACTLLVFVATRNWLAAMQVGDGLIVARPKERSNYQLLFQPDKGEYVNETTPVTSRNAAQKMKVDVWLGEYEFICAATDGIENISLVKRQEPYDNFFKGLEEQIMRSGKTQPEKEAELNEFLTSEKINQKTDDDKTILMVSYTFTNSLSGLSNFPKKSKSLLTDTSLEVRKELTSSHQTQDVSDSGEIIEPKISSSIDSRLLAELSTEIEKLNQNGISIYITRNNRNQLEVYFDSPRSLKQDKFISKFLKNLFKTNTITFYNQHKNEYQRFWQTSRKFHNSKPWIFYGFYLVIYSGLFLTALISLLFLFFTILANKPLMMIYVQKIL